MTPKLFLGDRNYSSWSFRPWLALKWGAIAFDEEVREIRTVSGPRAPEILAISPSGRVPALQIDGAVIYDSLSICEWAYEQNAALWPADPIARALGRSAAAEMHSGFADLRNALPMNFRRPVGAPPALAEGVERDIARVHALWEGLRARFGKGGDFLLGARSIADAYYAPVAARFRTYAIACPPVVAAYCQTIFADPAYKAWEQAAHNETRTIADYEVSL